MTPRIFGRTALMLITLFGLVSVAACQSRHEPAATPVELTRNRPTKSAPSSAPLKDEIPPEVLGEVMKAQLEGLGRMERYEYREAADAFRTVHRLAPGWIPGSINLAIALLNDTGVKEDEAKKAGVLAQSTTSPKCSNSSPLSWSAIQITPTPTIAVASSSKIKGRWSRPTGTSSA